MTEQLTVTRQDGVMTITFNRPEKKNAINRAMYGAATDALLEADKDPAIRCVLIQGAGDCFTAGNDLADFAAINTGEDDHGGSRGGTSFIRAIGTVEKPVVAAVHGLAVGIGVTLLLHCDLVYVAEDAKLSAPFVNLALVPEAASSLLLPARIGHARAFAMFVLGEPVTGVQAAQSGLANAALPPHEVHARALHVARTVAARPAGAVRATKRLMRQAEAIQAKMEEELVLFGQRLKTAEAAEAFAAFAERRAPDFTKVAS